MSEDEFREISSRTWSRAADSIAKNGYLEGASEGRDSAFQDSFDLGYREGFHFGINIGLHQGLKSSGGSESSEEDIMLQKMNCQMCLDQTLKGEHVSNIDNIQKECNSRKANEISRIQK